MISLHDLLFGGIQMVWEMFQEAPILIGGLVVGAACAGTWAIRKTRVAKGTGSQTILIVLMTFAILCWLILFMANGEDWILKTFIR